jgi:mRNA interferase MazF
MDKKQVINQGDVFWVKPNGKSEIPHPHVVLQEDVFNHSRIETVVVCAVTSNMQRASLPGNVVLDAGEANLPKASVVEVSKVSSVDKSQFGEYIGSVSGERVQQILAGMRFLQRSFFEE